MADHSEYLKLARERFAQALKDEKTLRSEAALDFRFIAGDQWDAKAKALREAHGRPIVTSNKLGPFVQQVANEARQNKPSIKFRPTDDAADKDTAEVFEGLARYVQYDGRADVAYETALEHAASGGFGYFRYRTEFVKGSFDVELQTETVVDPFSIYGVLIPTVLRKPVRWAFAAKSLTHEEFKAAYPLSNLVSWGFDSDNAKMGGDFITSNTVVVAEYWTLETTRRRIAELPDGTVVPFDHVPQGIEVKRTRFEDVCKVKSAVINGVEVLDDSETEWVGSTIPIYCVTGKVIIQENDEITIKSVIRDSRGTQQLINFGKSRIAETLGTPPVSPYKAVAGQLEGFEDDWQNSAHKPTAVLQYHAKVDGLDAVLGPPQREVYEPPIAALSAFVAQETDEIKQQTSIHDPSLGSNPRDMSGIALQRLQNKAGLSNLHFLDNLGRKHREAGADLAEVLPKIYDADRQIQILGKDDTEKIVRINAPYVDESGKPRYYNLSAGKYDVKVSIGPSTNSKREEASLYYGETFQKAPQLMNVMGDIYFRNSDFAGADEAADRMKKFIELTQPGLIEDPNAEQQPIPPQVKAMLEQGKQAITALSGELQAAAAEVKTLKSKERIEFEKLQIQREEMQLKYRLEIAKLGSHEDLAILDRELQVSNERAEFAERQQQTEFEREQFERQQATQAAAAQPQAQPQAAAGV